jgi:4-alpha-glucanotransferase
MNTPGTTQGNWRWRFSWDQLHDEIRDWLRRVVALYGRK